MSELLAVPFGSLLRSLRTAAGLTQEELAEAARVSYRTVSDLERGVSRSPHRDTARLLADALGLSGDELARFEEAARGRRSATETAAPGSPPEGITAAARTVPRQLPAHTAHFVGRAGELAALTGLLDKAAGPRKLTAGMTMISAIGGTAGIGKAALAVRWAHQVADRFPDGQLYANLHGFDPAAPPVRPAEVIRDFLGALGVDPLGIPVSLDAQAALYRSLLAGRRFLLLLDDARDAEQVRPLLPGTETCLVVVTSRRQLGSLAAREGAQLLDPGLLTIIEARELLTRHLGSPPGIAPGRHERAPERGAASPFMVNTSRHSPAPCRPWPYNANYQTKKTNTLRPKH